MGIRHLACLSEDVHAIGFKQLDIKNSKKSTKLDIANVPTFQDSKKEPTVTILPTPIRFPLKSCRVLIAVFDFRV